MLALKTIWDRVMAGRAEAVTDRLWAAMVIYAWILSVAAMPTIVLALALGSTVTANFFTGLALMGYYVWIGILACGCMIPFAGIAMIVLMPILLNSGALGVFGLSMSDWWVAVFFWVPWALGIAGQVLMDMLTISGAFSRSAVVRTSGRTPYPSF